MGYWMKFDEVSHEYGLTLVKEISFDEPVGHDPASTLPYQFAFEANALLIGK